MNKKEANKLHEWIAYLYALKNDLNTQELPSISNKIYVHAIKLENFLNTKIKKNYVKKSNA